MKVVINEDAIAALHLTRNPVGSYIGSGKQKMEVAGVLKNFNFNIIGVCHPATLGLFIMPDSSR